MLFRSDNADALAAINREADVVEDPLLLIEFFPIAEENLLQLIILVGVKLERFADASALDDRLR